MNKSNQNFSLQIKYNQLGKNLKSAVFVLVILYCMQFRVIQLYYNFTKQGTLAQYISNKWFILASTHPQFKLHDFLAYLMSSMDTSRNTKYWAAEMQIAKKWS